MLNTHVKLELLDATRGSGLDEKKVSAGGGGAPSAPPPHDVSDRYPFSTFCGMLESMLGKPTLPERLGILESFWKGIKGNVTKAHGAAAKVDHYPFMRLLLPHLDSTRPSYGLKESKIAQYYTRILQIPQDGADAQRMLRWKDPSKNSNAASTHFSDVVYAVLVKRGFSGADAGRNRLSVKGMNDALDALSIADTPEKKRGLLMNLLRVTTAVEQKWFIRVVVKDMRVHMQHTTVLNRFHPAATPILNATMDLKKVCESCLDETVAAEPSSKALSLFKPFSPMLASVVSREKLAAILQSTQMSLEPKFDGERMLLHYERQTMKLEMWTRNANDYTPVYGPKFTSTVLECVRCAENCIIDGEILVYSRSTGAFKPFGTNKTFALDAGENADEQFCYMAFDLVYLNGAPVVYESLKVRREKLKGIVTAKAKHFELVPHRVVPDVGSILKGLDDAVGGGFEGIVLKNDESTYGFGERKNHWLKLKRDHIEGLADSLDLMIVGGYYGTKFGKLHISHFLLAVADDDHVWHTYAKVGSGYNEREHAALTKRLEPHWVPYSSEHPPVILGDWKPASDDTPDFWIDPRHSVVLEVIGYSYNETVKFKVGRTIRFPRVKHIRYDKSIADADTLAQVTKIMDASADGRKRAADLGEGFILTRQAKKTGAKKLAELLDPTPMNFVASGTTQRIGGGLEGESTALQRDGVGLRLCVLQAGAEWPKEALEGVIRSHGGEVVANPDAESFLIADSAHSAKVKHWRHAVEANAAAAGKYRHRSVIHVAWLLDSVRARKVLPLAPRYMVYTAPDLRATFTQTMDKYGDSYIAEGTVESYRLALEEAKKAMAEEQVPEAAPAPPHPAPPAPAVGEVTPKKRSAAAAALETPPPSKRAKKSGDAASAKMSPGKAAGRAAALAAVGEDTCRAAAARLDLGMPERVCLRFFSGLLVSVDVGDVVADPEFELAVLSFVAHGGAVCPRPRASHYMTQGLVIHHHLVHRLGGAPPAHPPPPRVPLLDAAWVRESLDAGVQLSTGPYVPRVDDPHPTVRELASQLSRGTGTGVEVEADDGDDGANGDDRSDTTRSDGDLDLSLSCALFPG
eukprot:TRINITY_DN16347_c0_g1_i1.p1 TRINITY_DN16347_c0_g1~~TRINITY_DN16347_c0_g1_i1.p1  ORF type:complete len:1087 (+),score=405.82 TRINITY_DN16347_c0_g1_i1:63-3323(+)